MEYIVSYLTALLTLTTEMAPYLLLGFLFAGLLKVFLPQDLMNRYLGNSSFRSVLNASLLGIPLPLCSCGVLPAGISLYKNGASKGSSVSFLISTPQTGLDSILVTWSMLGLPFAIIRPIAALFTGLAGGILTNKLEPTATHIKGGKQPTSPKTKKYSIKAVLHYAFIEMLNDISKWLIIGLLIAAFISVIIPDHFFHDFQMNGLLGMLVILLASIPLYICATASVPIAAVLLLKGLSPGALLVFLMAGPATNAATMAVIGKNLGKKTLVIYLSTLIVGSLAFGLVLDYFLPGNWFLPLLHEAGSHEHDLLPVWLQYGAALFLGIMLVYNFYTNQRNRIAIKKKQMEAPSFSMNIPNLVIGVEGMTCQHCKAKVEGSLAGMKGVTNVEADTENNRVSIYGDKLDADAIGKLVTEIGYTFTGKID